MAVVVDVDLVLLFSVTLIEAFDPFLMCQRGVHYCNRNLEKPNVIWGVRTVKAGGCACRPVYALCDTLCHPAMGSDGCVSSGLWNGEVRELKRSEKVWGKHPRKRQPRKWTGLTETECSSSCDIQLRCMKWIADLCSGKELFVRGFPQDVADEKIKKFFGKKGVTVAHVKRIKGKQ